MKKFFKIHLIFLLAFCCFFSIDKVYAETLGNFNPRAIGYWRGDGSVAYPSVDSYSFEGDNWYGNYMSGNISKLNFEYVPTVLKHDEVYDYTFVVNYFTEDYSKFSATYSESYCDVSNPSSMQGTISNSTGIIHSGYSYRVVLNCRNIRYKQGVPVNLSLYFPVNTNSSGSQLIAVKSSVAVVERGSSNGDVVSGLDDLNETQKETNEKLDDLNETQKETNQAIKDTNDTLKDDDVSGASEEGSSFFDSFKNNDHGGLSGIITAPLTSINQMLNNKCSPMTATIKGKNVSLPCGYEFWSKMGPIQDFVNLTFGGLLCYHIIKALYRIIEGLKNPEDDRVEVMDL